MICTGRTGESRHCLGLASKPRILARDTPVVSPRTPSVDPLDTAQVEATRGLMTLPVYPELFPGHFWTTGIHGEGVRGRVLCNSRIQGAGGPGGVTHGVVMGGGEDSRSYGMLYWFRNYGAGLHPECKHVPRIRVEREEK